MRALAASRRLGLVSVASMLRDASSTIAASRPCRSADKPRTPHEGPAIAAAAKRIKSAPEALPSPEKAAKILPARDLRRGPARSSREARNNGILRMQRASSGSARRASSRNAGRAKLTGPPTSSRERAQTGKRQKAESESNELPAEGFFRVRFLDRDREELRSARAANAEARASLFSAPELSPSPVRDKASRAAPLKSER